LEIMSSYVGGQPIQKKKTHRVSHKKGGATGYDWVLGSVKKKVWEAGPAQYKPCGGVEVHHNKIGEMGPTKK